MCDSATHLGPLISSTDKKTKFCIWSSLNISMSDFAQLSYTVKCKLFNQ